MSRCLGIDPGSRYTAWAYLDGPALLDRGCIIGPVVATKTKPGVPWKSALAELSKHVEARIVEFRPDLVACEETQHAISHERAGKGAMSQAINTARTEEVIRGLAVSCERHGVPLVMVHPASSIAALACKRGATDGEVSAAAKRLFGVEGQWLAISSHEARAAGVALRGSQQYRLDMARERERAS